MAILENTTANTLVNGTNEDDSINNSAISVTIIAGDGNDYVYNMESNGLSKGNDVSIDTGMGNDSVFNDGCSATTINTGAGNDSVFNYGSYVTINTGDGADTVYNSWSDYATINTGAGNDSVYTYNSYKVTITTSKGDDTINLIYQRGDVIIYNAGDGNDVIYGFDRDDTLSISGGGSYSTAQSGYDLIVTVDAGQISLIGAAGKIYDSNIVFEQTVEANSWTLSGTTAKYGTSSNTLVTVSGVKSTSGLSVSGDVVTISNSALSQETVTISDGYNLALASDVVQSSTVVGGWSFSNSVATYKDVSNTAGYQLVNNQISYVEAGGGETLVTVNGVKSKNGITLNDKVVTVAASSLGTKNVTVNGDGYTLALGSDVANPSISNAWSYSNSKAIYKQTTTAGYTLANNSIIYSKKSTKTLVTVKGVKSVSGLSVNDKIVTVSKASLNAKKITISGTGYKLALADDVPKPTAAATKWTLNNSTAAYQTASTTAGYTLASNGTSITYSKKKSATTLATIKGVKSKSGLSVKNGIITLKNSALNKKVTVSGSYEFNFAAGYNNGAIICSAKADTIKVVGKGLTVTGGKGNDILTSSGKGNVFVYKSGDGKDIIRNFSASDTLSISGSADVTTSGDNVIFTVGEGKITLAGAADKNFTYKDSNGEHIYPPEDESDPTVKIIPSSYSKSSIKVSDEIITVDASALKKGIKIVGNDLNNSIVGGKGNDTIDGYTGDDTLTGGDGADVFAYMDGDGNDVITDYEQADKISIVSGAVNGISINRRDVVFDVGTYGEKITLTGAADKGITYIDAGGREHNWFNGNEVVTFNDKRSTVTLAKKYWKDNFDVADYGDYKTINASAVTQDLLIKGNENANNISGGHGNDTLYGGKGGDTLEGGDGADVFVYRKGDGKDTIVDYTAEDIIKIESGALSGNVVIKDNDVVFTVGVGKITVQNAAANGTKITIIDEDGKISTQSYGNVAWFLEDDNNFSTDNELSELVEEKTYLPAAQVDSFTLSKEENFIAYSVKNILRGEKIFGGI